MFLIGRVVFVSCYRSGKGFPALGCTGLGGPCLCALEVFRVNSVCGRASMNGDIGQGILEEHSFELQSCDQSNGGNTA